MQINFYGKAKGSAASKYDVWLNACVNSQNINNNTSNVTLKFYLKRNDGYPDSAYNLYENRNTVKILVGGKEKVNKYITIDTRNNVNCLLASWTGDISHNVDGTLSLSVSAEFIMDNVTITGGTASGVLTPTAIARKSTLSLSSSSVNPGGTVKVDVDSSSSSFSHKITCSIGTKKQIIQLEKGVLSKSITIPVSWAQEVLNSLKADIKVTLVTYNGTTSIGTNSYNLSFIIPATDEYKPFFDIDISEPEGNVLPVDAYVQSISRISVSPKNLQFKHGASLSEVSVTVGKVTVKKNPAAFLLIDSGDVNVSVSVRDSRGLKTVKKMTIKVLDYCPPSVDILELSRCNADGLPDRYGENLRIKYKVVYSSLEDSNSCVVTAQYKTNNDEEYSVPQILEAGDTVIGNNCISVGNSYSVRFCISDSISPNREVALRYISSANIPFNIKSGGNGAAFGKFSETENELSVGWDLSVDGNVNISGTVLFNELTVSSEDIVSETVGSVRYYPCFNSCYVSMRFKVSELSSNERYTLCYLTDYAPKRFAPLTAFANTTGFVGCYAGVTYNDGAVIFCSDTPIPADTYIYISGMYLV